MYLTIPEIILLATAIIGTAVIACYLLRQDKRKAEEDMVWWAGLFLRLATEVITTQGYRINVDKDGKITMTKKGQHEKGDGENLRCDKQQTGQTLNDKKGENLADYRNRSNLFGNPRPRSRNVSDTDTRKQTVVRSSAGVCDICGEPSCYRSATTPRTVKSGSDDNV